MKKVFFIVFLLNTYVLFGQNDKTNLGDTNTYATVLGVKEISDLGRQGFNENVLLEFSFVELNDGLLYNFTEVISMVDTLTNNQYSNQSNLNSKVLSPQEAAKYVGFSIKDLGGIIFKNCFGLRANILDSLQKFKTDDKIILLGKIVKLSEGDEFGFLVNKILTSSQGLNTKMVVSYITTSDLMNSRDSLTQNETSSNPIKTFIYVFVFFTIIILVSIKIFKNQGKS
jgi:hypothetical protein